MGLCVVMIFAPVRDPDRLLSLLRRHAYGFACFFARLCLRFTGRFDFAPLKLAAVAALCFCF